MVTPDAVLPARLGLFAVVRKTLDLFGMPAAAVELVAVVDLSAAEVTVGQDSRAELAGLLAGDDLVLEGGGGDHLETLICRRISSSALGGASESLPPIMALRFNIRFVT